MALLQMRLEQKTTVCADFAKAMHKTKAEFGKRQVHHSLVTSRAVRYRPFHRLGVDRHNQIILHLTWLPHKRLRAHPTASSLAFSPCPTGPVAA